MKARATKSGQLLVFEGADGVGKSELVHLFSSWLVKEGYLTEVYSFPGKEEGTLGRLVYELHARPEQFGVLRLTAASLQNLHIAAHLDAIERRILPSLKSGHTVVLDRFWWSTYVYGITSGVDRLILERMISTEKAAWGSVKPRVVYVVDRGTPLRAEPLELWRKWRKNYRKLMSTEKKHHPCEVVANDHGVEQTLARLVRSWKTLSRA
jgi:dTMP kinase